MPRIPASEVRAGMIRDYGTSHLRVARVEPAKQRPEPFPRHPAGAVTVWYAAGWGHTLAPDDLVTVLEDETRG